MSLEPREDRLRPSDANSIKVIFFPLFQVPDTQQTLKQYSWNQQLGPRPYLTLARAAALVWASIQSSSSRRWPKMYLISSTSCCTCRVRSQGPRVN